MRASLSIVSSDGVSEKFAVNLFREMSEYNTRWQKTLQCLRGRTPCLHSNINEFLTEPSAINTHTAEPFNERGRRGAVRTLAQGNTTVLPVGIKSHFWQANHTLENSSQLFRMANVTLVAKTTLDDFPRGVAEISLRLHRQQNFNWRRTRSQTLYTFSSAVVTGISKLVIK